MIGWTFVAIGVLTCVIVGLIAWFAQAPPPPEHYDVKGLTGLWDQDE